MLKFAGTAPVIIYDNLRYLSQYDEDEVLFPPGTFKIDHSSIGMNIRGGKQVITVSFTPKKNIDFNALEQKANNAFKNRYAMNATQRKVNNLNNMWRKMKIQEINKEFNEVAWKNLSKLATIERRLNIQEPKNNAWHKKKAILEAMKRRLQIRGFQLKKRKATLERPN